MTLSLYRSIIRPCTEYCCHVRSDAPSCYLELLKKLQKWICKTVGPSLAASVEVLAHRWNVASRSIFYRNYLVFIWTDSTLSYCPGRSTCYSEGFHNFSVTIRRCYKDVYANNFFPRATKLWNSQPIECFPLTCDLSDFTSRINKHFVTMVSF